MYAYQRCFWKAQLRVQGQCHSFNSKLRIHFIYKQLDFSGLRLKFWHLLSKNGRTVRYFQNFLSPNERTHFEKTFEHLLGIRIPLDLSNIANSVKQLEAQPKNGVSYKETYITTEIECG